MAHFISTEGIKATPNSNSLNPEIILKFHAKHGNNFLPIELTGDLLGPDEKIIGKAYQQLFNGSKESLYAKDSTDREITPYYSLSCTLTERALNYIEEVRHKNTKRDIHLKLKLYFKIILSQFGPHLQGVQHVLLDKEIVQLVQEVIIPSSDWIHDFLPAFGKGKYIVLEIPQPDFTNGSSFVDEKINEAIDSIPKMQKELLTGEWTEVIKESRPIWELVNEKTSKELYGYLSQSGFSEEAITHFTNSISELFKFSSKFIHKVDKSKEKLNPKIIASKEDAYLIYSLCLNVVNLITCKIKKLDRQEVSV